MVLSPFSCRSIPLMLLLAVAPISFAMGQDGLIGADYPAAKYPTGPGGDRVEVVDVDGDGLDDLVTTSRLGVDGLISVLFGRGDGTFEAGLDIVVPGRPEDTVAVDLDSDGHCELVTASRNGGEVRLFRNLGGRTFGNPETVAVAGAPRDLALLDADGDGRIDVVVGDAAPAQLIVLLADGVGGLVATTPIALGRPAVRIDVGDVDCDGRADILVSDFIGTAFDLVRQTAGGFGPPETIFVGPTVRRPVLRDATNDGYLDIAFPEWNANRIFVMVGNGDGTFAPPQHYWVGEGPQSVEVADLDEDGVADFIVTRESTFGQIGGRLEVIAGDPNTIFGARQPAVRTGSNPRGTATGDFDGDGALDVAVVNSLGADVAILRGRGDLSLEVPITLDVSPLAPQGIVSGDFDGDGLEDLVVCDGESGTMLFCPGDGRGNFDVGASSSTDVHCWVARAADVDGDGALDVLVQGRQGGVSGQIAVALNDGSGSFSVSARLPHEQETARLLELGDIDGDGHVDIVTTRSFSRIATWLGQGDGTFVQGPNPTGIDGAHSFDLGDANGDGHLDVVAGAANARRINTYFGDGTGLLTLTQSTSTGDVGIGLIRLGDVNGDGIQDVVHALTFGQSGDGIGVFEGVGDGTFLPGSSWQTSTEPTTLLVADVDVDGQPEVLVGASAAVSDIEVVDFVASGQPGASTLYSGSLDASAITVGDFDKDGNPDLAVASSDAREVTVLVNRADVRLANYCDPFANSTGAPARLLAEGSRSLTRNDLTLVARQMPPGELVVWFAGLQSGSRLLIGANLCIAGPLQRLTAPRSAGPDGCDTFMMALASTQLMPGMTVYFQTWFTDPAGIAPHFNFTDGLAVLLRP